ncbi:MAG: PAS domain-containing protein, partial [Nannocystaceae bacterium]
MNSDPSPAAELAASHIDGALVICAGKIVYANEAARAIFGLPSEAVDGTLVAPLLGLGHASDVDGWLGERAGQPYEERLYRDSGEPFAARVGSVVLDAVEQRFGLSIQDMSEARAVADALEKELVALEASRMALIESKQS